MTENKPSGLPLLSPPPPPPPSEQVMVVCPAPKVDALLLLMQQNLFDHKERSRIQESAVGKELQETFQKCRPYRKKLLENREKPKDEQELKENMWRYQCCLSMAACPERMTKYRRCWAREYYKIPPDAIRELKERGVADEQIFQSICDSERRAVERCVGSIVARAVRAADSDQGV